MASSDGGGCVVGVAVVEVAAGTNRVVVVVCVGT